MSKGAIPLLSIDTTVIDNDDDAPSTAFVLVAVVVLDDDDLHSIGRKIDINEVINRWCYCCW